MDNMPAPGLATVRFKQSPLMVTYLACFVICDFKSKIVTMSGDKPFGVVVPKHMINETDFPATSGRDAINYYIDYLGVDFPLPKEGR